MRSPRIQPMSPSLEARAQPRLHCSMLSGGSPGRAGDRLRLLVGLQVEQQQRAFGEERAAAHRAQVVEQRQQHQREIAPAGEHPLEVAGQLHHRAQQRIQALRLALALA